jgi:fatty acid desaturase
MKMSIKLESIILETIYFPQYLNLCIFVVVVLTLRLIYLFFKIRHEYHHSSKLSIDAKKPENEIWYSYFRLKENSDTRLSQIKLLVYISILLEIYALLNILKGFSMGNYTGDASMEVFRNMITYYIKEAVFISTIFLIFWVLIAVCFFVIRRKFLSISFEIEPSGPQKEV